MKESAEWIHKQPQGVKKSLWSQENNLVRNGDNNTFLQPKLSIGSSDDAYEKEADAVADKITQTPDQTFITHKSSDSGLIQRDESDDKNQDEFSSKNNQLPLEARPDFLKLRTPFLERNASHLLRYDDVLGVWRYNFHFFRGLVLDGALAGKAANFTAPFAIDSQLKADNPKMWEQSDAEMNTSTIMGSFPLLGFDSDFGNLKLFPSIRKKSLDNDAKHSVVPNENFIQRKCAACEEEEQIRKKPDETSTSFLETITKQSTASIQTKSVVPNTIQRQNATPSAAVPVRGPNPSTCMTALCSQLRNPPQTFFNDPLRYSQSWITDVVSCLSSGASASNASHAAEIIENTRQELTAYIAYMASVQPLATTTDKRNYLDWLVSLCISKQRELSIEFHHNIVFDNVPTSGTGTSRLSPWVSYPSEWDEIEQALSAIPDEHLWGRTGATVHFRREMRHASGRNIGGETDPNAGTITIFDAGIGASPFTRSAGTGISATNQTIRHEVGHLVENTVSQSLQDDFMARIIGWHYFPEHFLLSNPPANDTHRTFQTQFCTELNLLNASGQCDHAQLVQFLGRIPSSGNLVLNGRIYTKSGSLVNSWPVGAVPGGEQYSYARTSPSDYFAEIYSFAVSNPEFLYLTLPPSQLDWLKQNVFHTQPIYDEVIVPMSNLAAGGNQAMIDRYGILLQSARRKFTRQQLESVARQLQEVITQLSLPDQAAVA